MTELELRSFNVTINNHGLDGKSLPKRLKLLQWGKNATANGDVYLNEKTLAVFDAIQKETGRDEDVALDFDHCTVPGSKEYVPGKPKNIAAYGNPKLIKGDGLYLEDLKWTPLGKEKASNYKDLSPACSVTKDGVVTGLHSAALTPNGAVYGLKFYSAKGFDDMINKMSVSDKGSSSPKETAIGFDANDEVDDYNKDGANAGVKKVGDKYEINDDIDCNDVDDMGTFDSNDEWGKSSGFIKDYDADDHYSKYGDVEYADKENHKYPINTKEHVKAAWAYINMPKNAAKYNSSKLSTIKGHIKTAAKKYGIEISENSADNKQTTTKTKTMSATNPSFPDAYKAQDWQYNIMNNQNIKKLSISDAIKKMAAEVGTENESDSARVLFAFLAEYLGLKPEIDGQLTTKENSEDYGLLQFSAKFDALKEEINQLKNEKSEELKRHEKFERDSLIKQATKEGKMITLSADSINKIDISILRELVATAPKTIPLTSNMRVFSSVHHDGVNGKVNNKPSREMAVSAFDSMISAAK